MSDAACACGKTLVSCPGCGEPSCQDCDGSFGPDCPHRSAANVDDLRSKLAGWHFAKESLTDGEREILAVAEAVLAELDRRDSNGYAR